MARAVAGALKSRSSEAHALVPGGWARAALRRAPVFAAASGRYPPHLARAVSRAGAHLDAAALFRRKVDGRIVAVHRFRNRIPLAAGLRFVGALTARGFTAGETFTHAGVGDAAARPCRRGLAPVQPTASTAGTGRRTTRGEEQCHAQQDYDTSRATREQHATPAGAGGHRVAGASECRGLCTLARDRSARFRTACRQDSASISSFVRQRRRGGRARTHPVPTAVQQLPWPIRCTAPQWGWRSQLEAPLRGQGDPATQSSRTSAAY